MSTGDLGMTKAVRAKVTATQVGREEISWAKLKESFNPPPPPPPITQEPYDAIIFKIELSFTFCTLPVSRCML